MASSFVRDNRHFAPVDEEQGFGPTTRALAVAGIGLRMVIVFAGIYALSMFI